MNSTGLKNKTHTHKTAHTPEVVYPYQLYPQRAIISKGTPCLVRRVKCAPCQTVRQDPLKPMDAMEDVVAEFTAREVPSSKRAATKYSASAPSARLPRNSLMPRSLSAVSGQLQPTKVLVRDHRNARRLEKVNKALELCTLHSAHAGPEDLICRHHVLFGGGDMYVWSSHIARLRINRIMQRDQCRRHV